MNNTLHLLIKEMRREVKSLKREMKEYTIDEDYIIAQLYQRPLAYTSNYLRLLQCVEDPYFKEKEFLKHNIKICKKDIKRGLYTNDARKNFLKYEKELFKIKKKAVRSNKESNIIKSNLEKILEGELSCLSITFNCDKDIDVITLENSENNKSIHIEVRSSSRNKLNFRQIPLIKFGFELEKEWSANLSILKSEITHINWLLEMLSVIIYEVLEYYGDKEATIKISK